MKRRVRAVVAAIVVAVVASFSPVQASSAEDVKREQDELVACRIAYINVGYVSVCV